MKKQYALLIGLIMVGLFMFSGCQTEEMIPLHRFNSGSYTVDILTPGGTLKSGDTPVSVRVRTGDSTVDISGATVMFSMPAMGTMPYMEMHTEFKTSADRSKLSGNVHFDMGGSWTGHVLVEVGEDSLTATFPIHVDD